MATVVLLLLTSTGMGSADITGETVTLSSGGIEDSGHFPDVYDLTAGDITLAFTYDGTGMVDDFGGAAHAWAELGVRSQSLVDDFSPYGTIVLYTGTATVDLFADQDVDIGHVTAAIDGDYLNVTYHLEGWCMTQSHFAAAMSLAGLPQNSKGNAIPGQFPFGEAYGSCMTGDVDLPPILLADIAGFTPGAILYFAAHAVVWDMASGTTLNLVSGPGVGIVGGGAAVAAKEPFSYATCSAYKTSDATKSVWDNGIALADFNYFNTNPKADWIWSTPDPLNPVAGDVVTFQSTFDIPGLPTGGSLRVTADNGYAATLNGLFLGSAQLGGGFPGTLRELVPGQLLPKAGAWGVSSQGWQTVENHSLTGLTTGTNVLQIVAANEYMWSDDRYYSVSPYTSGPVATDPMPNVNGISDCYNPGGLIFKASVSYYARSESAWAGTGDFPGRNWATYFTLTPTQVTVQGAGVWLATDYHWTANTFDPDVTPSLDLDDKLLLQRMGGQGEGAYNLPSAPPVAGNNHRFWWDRDGVDPWQNPATANTGGIYQIVITLHATSASTGTAYMKIRDLDQGFETNGNWNTIELTPAGMTFTGDMKHLVVFYGLVGYGATHTATFSNITVTQAP